MHIYICLRTLTDLHAFRCMHTIQILLYSGSVLTFNSNKADQSGGGIRAKTISTVSLFAVRNKNCFIQFLNPGPNDIPPSQWVSSVHVSVFDVQCTLVRRMLVVVSRGLKLHAFVTQGTI